MHLLHILKYTFQDSIVFLIPQCPIQNRNVHISVLKDDALLDMEQVHCGICELGQLILVDMGTIIWQQTITKHYCLWTVKIIRIRRVYDRLVLNIYIYIYHIYICVRVRACVCCWKQWRFMWQYMFRFRGNYGTCATYTRYLGHM